MWAKQEIESIKKHFPNGDVNKIAQETGRSIAAIKVKANRIGVFLMPKINIWFKKVPLSKRIYLAGHFDGEGCASFAKKESRLTRSPVLMVAICNKETLALYQKHFNGVINEKKNLNGNKPMFCWRCSKYDDVYNFILSVIPYSIEKKEQLLLLKEFIELRQKERKTISFSEEFRHKANELHNKCTQLKKS